MSRLSGMGFAATLLMASAGMAQVYDVPWFTIDAGGAMGLSGGAFSMSGTTGQHDAGAAMSGGTFTLEGGFWPGASDDGCTGGEKVKKASCRDRNGSNQLTVLLVQGRPGDTFTVTLADNTSKSGNINNRGKGKAKFNDRPAAEAGTASAEWGCGAIDSKDYTCP